MWKIGLTGGIACGKSTVVTMLRERGAYVIDSDQIARTVVEPDQPAWQDIVSYFGTDVLRGDHTIDRAKLGALVFDDPQARERLEQFTHPRIEKDMAQLLKVATGKHHNMIVIDVPLLFEVGWNRRVDRIWLVYVEPIIQLKRLMQRDGSDREQAEARIRAQWPMERKKMLADVLIDNSGSMEDTRELVCRYWAEEQELARTRMV